MTCLLCFALLITYIQPAFANYLQIEGSMGSAIKTVL